MATLYLETTIPSYLTAWPARETVLAGQQVTTRTWWDQERSRFDLRISQFVLDEASAGDPDAAQRRLAVLAGIPLLPITSEAEDLAAELAHLLALPAKAQLDAAHISLCIIAGVDFLLTWNCRHIANAVHRRKIEDFCRERNLTSPVICTPDELLSHDDHESTS